MLGGYRKEPPPGCTPALRRHQLPMAQVFCGSSEATRLARLIAGTGG